MKELDFIKVLMTERVEAGNSPTITERLEFIKATQLERIATALEKIANERHQ